MEVVVIFFCVVLTILVSIFLFPDVVGCHGPRGFRKVREAGRMNVLQISSKSDLMVPSNEQKTSKQANKQTKHKSKTNSPTDLSEINTNPARKSPIQPWGAEVFFIVGFFLGVWQGKDFLECRPNISWIGKNNSLVDVFWFDPARDMYLSTVLICE